MFKKMLSGMLVASVMFALCSCHTDTSKGVENYESNHEKSETTVTQSSTVVVDSFESLENSINEETKKAVETLTKKYEELSKNITTYSDYVDNATEIEKFYEKITSTSEQISIKLYGYCVVYAEKILQSDMSITDMYDAFDDIYDCIYEDAADILYDGIYDGLLKDIYDDFYEGVLDKRDDNVSYNDWYDARSSEYNMWYDARSDCYEHWYDMRSDVYGFWSDMRNKLYSDDMERAKKIFDKFNADVQKMLG